MFNNKRMIIILLAIFIIVSVLFFRHIANNTLALENELKHIEGTITKNNNLSNNNQISYIVSLNETHKIISSLNSVIIATIFYLLIIIVYGVYLIYFLLDIYKKIV